MEDKSKSQIIRESNISNYIPMMTKENLLISLFSNSDVERDRKIGESLDNKKASVLSDILSSITTEPVTTREMLFNLYSNVKDKGSDLINIDEAGNFTNYFMTNQPWPGYEMHALL